MTPLPRTSCPRCLLLQVAFNCPVFEALVIYGWNEAIRGEYARPHIE